MYIMSNQVSSGKLNLATTTEAIPISLPLRQAYASNPLRQTYASNRQVDREVEFEVIGLARNIVSRCTIGKLMLPENPLIYLIPYAPRLLTSNCRVISM